MGNYFSSDPLEPKKMCYLQYAYRRCLVIYGYTMFKM